MSAANVILFAPTPTITAEECDRGIDWRARAWDVWEVNRSGGFLMATVAAVVLMVSAGAALGAHALSPERYAALDAVYVALVPFDRDRVPASALTAAKRACNGLDPADPLLAPLRGECLAIVRGVRPTDRLARCTTRRSCRRAVRDLRRAITSYLAHAVAANRVIETYVPDPVCRSALRVSTRELDAVRQFRLALRALERALISGSRVDMRRARKRLDAIEDPGLSARQERDRFRSACA